MNKDIIQNIFIGIMAGGILLLGGGVYLINQQLMSVTDAVRQLEGRKVPGTGPAPTTPSASSPTTQLVSRTAFGPLVSPDGQWTLSVKTQGNAWDAGNVFVNQLVISDASGMDTILHENRTRPVSGDFLPGTEIWRPVGWSADGKKVYYTTELNSEADPSGKWVVGYIAAGRYSESLNEVDVATKRVVVIHTANRPRGDTDAANPFGEYRDIHARKGLMAYHRFDMDPEVGMGKTYQVLLVSDLRASNTREIMRVDMKEDDGIASAVLSPDGKLIAVMTYHSRGFDELAQTPGYRYALAVYDVQTGQKKKDFGMPNEERMIWELKSWKNNSTLTVREWLDASEYDELKDFKVD